MDSNILLVLMVKNEGKILQRCLDSANAFVDAVLVFDTGSSDNTLEIAHAYKATKVEVWQKPWCNFGVSRTQSLHTARAYAVRLGWCLDKTYALVLDADMCLQGSPEKLRQLLETKPKGVQVYWSGGHGTVLCDSSQAACIDDIGDGGAKADKFERDERLLLAGLQEKPNCERYMFYLAQTYHCMKRHEEAIAWYQKRIEAGGWIEEVWYSHYMIANNLLAIGKPIEAEVVVQRGALIHPERIEALLLLVRHLRETSQPFKAWHYLLEAEKQKRPDGARLFLETDAYTHRLQCERLILKRRIETAGQS